MPKAEVPDDPAQGMHDLYTKEPLAEGKVVWASVLLASDYSFLTWE